MKLKLKRIIVGMMICIMGFSIPTFANTEKEMGKPKGPIFMGKVIAVDEKDKDNNIKIRVKGYIKGCEVYEEELLVIISEDTKIIASNCNESKGCEKSKSEEDKKKCENIDINVGVGDNVFICLSEIMTKSIPPQVVAKKIQVTKIKS